MPVPSLRQAFGDRLFAIVPAGAARSAPPDTIYEQALSQVLQLVRSDRGGHVATALIKAAMPSPQTR